MKKSVFLSILMLLAILVSSCAPAATPTAEAPAAGAPATEAPSGEEPLEIVMVAKAEGISWFDDMRVGVEQFGKDYGVNAYQIAPEGGDPAKQAQMVEDLIAKGVDAILVVPNDPKSMEPVLKKAKEKGIVVVAHEAQQLAPIVDFDMEAFKNEYFGEVMFEALAQAMGGEGQFTGFVGALTMETHMQWFNAGLKYVQENYPDMEFVSPEPYEDMNDEKISYAKFQEILFNLPRSERRLRHLRFFDQHDRSRAPGEKQHAGYGCRSGSALADWSLHHRGLDQARPMLAAGGCRLRHRPDCLQNLER